VISRRQFLGTLITAAAAFSAGSNTIFASAAGDKSLDIYNIHTGESLKTVYCSGGLYDYEALEKINYVLRCHYTNEVKAIDTGVLDLLSSIKDKVGSNRQLNIISGYRSPDYNSFLINSGRGAAKDSLHLKGLAIDFSIDGISNNTLSGIAKSFIAGGVGKYPEFVHIDIGRVRYW